MVHKPVMLNEVIKYLNIQPKAKIIDATLNGGGHTRGILEKYQDVKVLGIEYDPDIFQEFKPESLNPKLESRIIIVNDSYINLRSIVEKYNFRPDGIIFDLGLSSWHYERSGRGFSFKRDEPLDMNYGRGTNAEGHGRTAAEVVNVYSKEELERVIREYGEEQFSKQIADNIVRARKMEPILKTSELVEVIG